MSVEAILDRLAKAGVSIWLDEEGKLRIEKRAPAELKELVRAHKEALSEFLRALDVMNVACVGLTRLALGEQALTFPPGADLDEIRWAASVLQMDSLPLVLNDEGCRWISYDEWRSRRPLGSRQAPTSPSSKRRAGESAKLVFGRKSA